MPLEGNPGWSTVEERTLVLAPHGRDAHIIGQVLSGTGIACTPCWALEEMVAELKIGAATALVTSEALAGKNMAPLIRWLSAQPPWSDFPFILLVSARAATDASLLLLEQLGNVVILERPLNAQTLSRAALSAHRIRRRQYQSRQELNTLSIAEERLKLALTAGRMGAWEMTLPDLRLTTSDTCKANFGRNPQAEFTRRDWLDAVHPDDATRYRSIVDRAIAALAGFDVEFRVVWPDGSVHWLQVRGETSAGADGRPARVAGVSMDVTERLNSREQLRESRQALQELNDSLETRILQRTEELAAVNDRLMREINERERTQAALVQAQKMEAIGQLTGGIAHDFNNLLHVIAGNVDLIDHIATDERIKRFAETAKKASQRGARLTSQLLAFARNQRLDLKPVNLQASIQGLKELLAMSVGSSIHVELDLANDMPAALADLNQIEMAVLNLAINARDAMPDGGALTVRCELRAPEREMLPEPRYAVISVTDTGIGIKPENLAKVFDPFFTTKGIGKGTGLGLSQVYGVARQSGGTARIFSELGRGTTVEIWLPLADAEAVMERREEGRSEDEADNSRISVLVVEDEPQVRQFLVQSLELLGYRVREAEDGIAGLARFDEERPDLLIVDFLMPGMGGAEVVARVTALAPEVPIIVATGYADMRAIDKVIGRNAVLRKPFQINELDKSVRAALASRLH